MKNSADQGGCYPQRPKAEVDNTFLSSAEFFIFYESRIQIIALLFIQNISPFLKEFRHFALFFAHQK